MAATLTSLAGRGKGRVVTAAATIPRAATNGVVSIIVTRDAQGADIGHERGACGRLWEMGGLDRAVIIDDAPPGTQAPASLVGFGRTTMPAPVGFRPGHSRPLSGKAHARFGLAPPRPGPVPGPDTDQAHARAARTRAAATSPAQSAPDPQRAGHIARAGITAGGLLGIVLAGMPLFGALAAPAPATDAMTRKAVAQLGTGAMRTGARSAMPSRIGDARTTVLPPGQPLPRPPASAGAQGGATTLVLKILAHDDAAAAIIRAGGDARDAAAIGRAVAAAGTQRAGDVTMRLTLGAPAPGQDVSSSRPVDAAIIQPRFDTVVEARRSGPAEPLSLVIRRLAVTTRLVPLSGTVGADGLFRAARAAGVPLSLAVDALKALAPRIAAGDTLRAGDRFAMVAAVRDAARSVDPAMAHDEPVLVYAGLLRDGRPVARLLPWGAKGQARWLDAADARGALGPGRPMADAPKGDGVTGGIVRPTDGRVTSAYGGRRHPILGYWKMHRGIDFAGSVGTPVRAARTGIITRTGWNGGYGRYVRIDHGTALASGYAHLSRILVSPGQKVEAGQLIGLVGSTGFSTGPHLHFEVYERGAPVDPSRLGLGTMAAPARSPATLPAPEYAAFMARLARMERIAGIAGATSAPAPTPTPTPASATPSGIRR